MGLSAGATPTYINAHLRIEAKNQRERAMKSLKLPRSLHSSHGGKTLIPFPNRKLALSTGNNDLWDYADLFTRTITLFSPSIFLSGHCDLKEARRLQFSMSSTSASIQPMSEELMGDTSKDLPVRGDSICRQFLSLLPMVTRFPERYLVLQLHKGAYVPMMWRM